MDYYLEPKLQTDIKLLQTTWNTYPNLSTGEIKRLSPHSRRQFTDLCEVYKILKCYHEMKVTIFFTFLNMKMREHSPKLMKQNSKTVSTSSIFSLRVIDRWNSFLRDVLNATTMAILKMKLKILLK